MRRASLMPLVAAVLLLPIVAIASHIELPAIDADCDHFAVSFRGQFRSSIIEAEYFLVVTIIDEAGVEKLRFEYSEQLPLDGERYQYFDYSWQWNDITDETIHLIGLLTVRAEMTLVAPWGERDLVDVDEAEAETTMVCDVVPNDGLTWGGLKSSYR